MGKLLVVSYTKKEQDGKEKTTHVVDVRRLSDKISEEEQRAAILEGVKKLPEELQKEHLFQASLGYTEAEKAKLAASSSRTSSSSTLAASHSKSPHKKQKAKDGRVRSTYEMTIFLLTQAEEHDWFESTGSKKKDDRSANQQAWEEAREEFNAKFNTDVDLAAYKRKIGHLRKSLALQEANPDAPRKKSALTFLKDARQSKTDADTVEEDDEEGEEVTDDNDEED